MGTGNYKKKCILCTKYETRKAGGYCTGKGVEKNPNDTCNYFYIWAKYIEFMQDDRYKDKLYHYMEV